jgi:hypothetical protein
MRLYIVTEDPGFVQDLFRDWRCLLTVLSSLVVSVLRETEDPDSVHYLLVLWIRDTKDACPVNCWERLKITNRCIACKFYCLKTLKMPAQFFGCLAAEKDWRSRLSSWLASSTKEDGLKAKGLIGLDGLIMGKCTVIDAETIMAFQRFHTKKYYSRTLVLRPTEKTCVNFFESRRTIFNRREIWKKHCKHRV